MPSGDVETNTEFWVEPDALQSCQVTHTRPPASTPADGSGNARKPRTPHDAETSAIHAGPLHVAPPSVDLDAAIEKPFSSQRKATTSSPVGRITGNAPTPGRTPRSTPADQVAPPSSDQRTASMKRLVDVGLVDREQRGKWAYFSLKSAAVEKFALVTDLKVVCC